jgi:hypothetical protein
MNLYVDVARRKQKKPTKLKQSSLRNNYERKKSGKQTKPNMKGVRSAKKPRRRKNGVKGKKNRGWRCIIPMARNSVLRVEKYGSGEGLRRRCRGLDLRIIPGRRGLRDKCTVSQGFLQILQ